MKHAVQRRERATRRPWIAVLVLGALSIAVASSFALSSSGDHPATSTPSGAAARGMVTSPAPASSITTTQYGSSASSGLSTGELMVLMGLLALAGIVLVGLAIMPRRRNEEN